MYTKRVKSSLAVLEQHLKRMDENLRRAKANSRNDFVEQAIDHSKAVVKGKCEIFALFLCNIC